MKKKIIISILAVLIVVSSCIGIAINSKSNDNISTNKADPSTTSNITTTVHTTNETTTKADETTTKESTTAKSTTQKSSSSQKQSGSSGSSKSNSSQKQTTKKSTTTTKKETTTKAKSYAMTKDEIRNYALEQIAKIDGTIYVPEFTKENAGWYTPVVVYPDDTEAEIKEALRMDAKGVYNKYANGYNVYVENTTDYNGDKCMKVYFLYGHTGPDNVVIYAE